MTRSFTSSLRRLWLNVHLWIGVGLLVVLVPLSVSGSILVWHDGIDQALHPERYAVSGTQAGLPASAYAATAQRAFGDRATLTQIRLPQEPGDPVVAAGRMTTPTPPGGRPRTLNAWIDPPTGELLASAETAKGFTMVMHRLHGSLLIPGIGRKVVGWLGWALFVSSATGLWLWWPRHGSFLRALHWRRGASELFNLHHMIGFWLCLPLAVLSLTGVYISFPQTARALFGVAPPQAAAPPRPGSADPRFAPPVSQPATGIDQAVALALAAHPNATPVSINVPQQGRKPVWRIDLKSPGADRPLTLRIEDRTGALQPAAGRGGEGPDPLSRWMRRIHDGTDTGIVWQLIITLTGVAPLILSVTGTIMWLRRRARRLAMTHA